MRGTSDPASATITQAATFTYTFEAKADVTRKVTFRVANGSWDDGTAADKVVTPTGKEGDELRLAAKDIPAVGTKPGSGYRAGSWDVEPSATTAIEKDITYTYTYAKKGTATVTKAPRPES